MKFYTVSTFRNTLESLMQKPRDGYTSVVGDICKMLQKMPDNILRDTNDRVKQFPQFRIVKLRIANSGQHLPKTDGFRLIYFVSLVRMRLFSCVYIPNEDLKRPLTWWNQNIPVLNMSC